MSLINYKASINTSYLSTDLYDTIATAITTIGAAQTTILIDGYEDITEDASIPSNINLNLEMRGSAPRCLLISTVFTRAFIVSND